MWPGRLPVAGNLRLHGAAKRAAGVHGWLSWLGRDCASQIVGQGSRAGASSAETRKLNSRTCRPILFCLLLVNAVWSFDVRAGGDGDMTSASIAAEVQQQSDVKSKIPEPLIVGPQPPCQFNPDQGPEMVLIKGGKFLMGSPDVARHALVIR